MTGAVVFDVGETLIDETRLWEQAADAAGVIGRGPWGYLHEPPAQTLRIESLSDLPEALDV